VIKCTSCGKVLEGDFINVIIYQIEDEKHPGKFITKMEPSCPSGDYPRGYDPEGGTVVETCMSRLTTDKKLSGQSPRTKLMTREEVESVG
jgi:hypothetical protein